MCSTRWRRARLSRSPGDCVHRSIDRAGRGERLGRYASSIIIQRRKVAERLLDEVTLFLHQVEAIFRPEQQRILREVRNREAALEGRHILLVDDDARNVFALASVLESKGAKLRFARNGKEALAALESAQAPAASPWMWC